MALKAILLTNDEQFIKFLDPDLIRLDETRECNQLSTISMNYKIDNPQTAKELFKIGRKIWINGDENLKDCLYVINESLKNDFFSENEVEFEAEEVLTELNYAPLFSHTLIPEKTSLGYTIDNKGAVLVDRNALEKWFGNYFQIGVMQDCLNTYLQKISPIGTMTLMELLRFIEEETSNVFSTRYEKDLNSNVIHRYLDFLNPRSKKDSWNLRFEYHVLENYYSSDSYDIKSLHEDYGYSSETIHNEINDEGDDVSFENDDLKIRDVTKFQLNILENNLLKKSFLASKIGLTGRSQEYTIDIHYTETNNQGEVTINTLGETYDEYLASNPNSTYHMKETDNYTLTEKVTLGKTVTLQLVDLSTNEILQQQTIHPILNKTIGDVLNLGFNVENITFETDESDTYKAVAPILSLSDESSNTSLNKTDLKNVINNWLNLEVEKGDIVPMIVQRVSLTPTQINALGSSNVSNNYWARPLKPNDSTDSSEPTYEYLIGTAYWRAPFSKKEGEIYVADDEDTGVEYDKISGRQDFKKDEMQVSTPKICTVETSDEDKYAIFNDVCMKLKNKRFPELNIDVDVKNFNKNFRNNYAIFDKVYVKLPNCEELVIATVNKTIKNAYDIGENKVELTNYSNTLKASPARTMLDGTNISFNYPSNQNWNVKLVNLESDASVNGKLITCTLVKLEENNSTIITSYNLETNENGEINLALSYDPGNYRMQCNFGGDAELESSSSTFDINVYGSITQNSPGQSSTSASKKGKAKTKTKKSYYTKYGVSPDGKSILAIGKPSTKGEKKKYGNNFYKVKFLRKCKCGSTKLFWGWNWGSKFRNKSESGSSTGRIICDHCGASYAIFGEGGKHDLTRIDPPKKSSKTEANKLKNGKFVYDQWTVTVAPKKVDGNNGGVISRSSTSKNQSAAVSNDIKKEALKIVKNKTGVKAAKELAKWVAEHIKTESRDGFYQSPSKTFSRKKGNDCCQADLLMHMLDAAGVIKEGIACYYVYVHKKTKKKGTLKHVFLKINGKWVDPMKKSPWGHYKTGYGAVKQASIKRYPYLPFNRKY